MTGIKSTIYRLTIALGLVALAFVWLVGSVEAAPLVPIELDNGQITLGGTGSNRLVEDGDCSQDDYMFLGILPPWHRGLNCGDIDLKAEFSTHEKTRIIITNITGILTRLAGLVAVIALIIAGFKYALSNGNPQKASGALKSIIHALSGLAVAVAATLLVESIYNRLTGGEATGPGLPKGDLSVTDTIGFVMLILGLISALMVVLQGMRYALSRGNPEKTGQARNGIVYALVGMVVALSSWSIVQFVLGRLVTSGDAGSVAGVGGLLGSIIGILIFIVGAISVIMVIIGSYQYIFSGGDSQKASSARGTILYALIGVVVSISAGPILTWVLERI